MMLMANGPGAMTRSHALALWAAARERAVDELANRAARLSEDGQKDEAAGLRAAARLLHLRAIQERAQAAACWADALWTCAPCRTARQ